MKKGKFPACICKSGAPALRRGHRLNPSRPMASDPVPTQEPGHQDEREEKQIPCRSRPGGRPKDPNLGARIIYGKHTPAGDPERCRAGAVACRRTETIRHQADSHRLGKAVEPGPDVPKISAPPMLNF